MSRQLKPCPDCGAPSGERHRAGCDIERCYHCGWQALGCLHFNDARRQAWNGKWPGEDVANAWTSSSTVTRTFPT